MSYWRQAFTDWNTLFFEELRTIFRDLGVLIFFFIVPLGYPLFYTFIYTNEVVREVPIVVVDDCRSTQSREYVRHLDATPDVKDVSYAANMSEARKLIKHRDAYGAVYIPRDFSLRLHRGEQVKVSAYADMSGMLYYKSVLTANTNVAWHSTLKSSYNALAKPQLNSKKCWNTPLLTKKCRCLIRKTVSPLSSFPPC